uniref:Uncharacterized protein n=1 Tax=viral metagenome TaxID=1070528 RepID=A0A6M3IDW3_9ZZZZ
MVEETKVEEEKKEKFDVINLIDPIEKVFGNQSGRVIKDFNKHCERSMRIPPIVATMVAIESYKLLKDIRNLLIDIKAQSIEEEFEEVEKKSTKKKIDLK